MRSIKAIRKTAIVLIITLSVITMVITWMRPERCIPHDKLIELYGRPDQCDHGHVILHCSDPDLYYQDDPSVLSSCGLTQSSSKTILADILPLPVCHHIESTLLSDKQLPVKLSPEPSESEGLVPNTVHYVTLGCERVFSFAKYLSVLSVHKFVDPDRIYFHGDCTPLGVWWEQTLKEVPNIYFRKHRRQKTIQGRPPMWIEHETDVIRLQILLAEGGIYLDTDVLFLSPIEPLRRYQVSLGREPSTHNMYLGNSVIMAQPNSPFLCMWLYAFREYKPLGIGDWGTYSVLTPGKIAMRFPEHVHVENTSFYKPSWDELDQIYTGFYDWGQNYVLHMWNHAATTQVIPDSPSAIPSLHEVNCTLHEIFRYIYFDEKIITAQKPSHASKPLMENSYQDYIGTWIFLSLCIPGIVIILLVYNKIKSSSLRLTPHTSLE